MRFSGLLASINVLALVALTSGTTAGIATATRPPPAGIASELPPSYRPPLPTLTVRRPFDAGVTKYGPGHRGVDLAAAADQPVYAAAAGVVSFAGAVAGRGVVVVQHADGIRTTYEPVRPGVVTGGSVVTGQPVGTLAGQHDGCPEACLHWGARRGDAYIDPLSLLRPLGPVRLLPWR